MAVKIALGVVNLGTVDKAGVAKTAVGKLVDERPADPHRQVIVDESSQYRSGCSHEHYQIDVKVTLGACQIGYRGTTTSDGNGINELSIVMSTNTSM